MKKTKLTRHAAIFSTTYPPAQDMLRRIRQKVVAKNLQRTLEVNPMMEAMSSTTMRTLGSREDEQRSGLDARSGGGSSSSLAPVGLTRDGLKQALLAKAVGDKSKTHSEKVSPKPSSAETTSATALRHERLPDSCPSESNAIMRLLGR